MELREHNILPQDGEAWYYKGFFSEEESLVLYDSLLRNIQWEQKQVRIYGRLINEPRLTAWYGDEGSEYIYSGVMHQPLLWTPELLGIEAKVEAKVEVKFNSVLLNLYRDGNDSMGWHKDDEKELGINPIIGSVSFGATRKFKFKHNALKKLTVDIELENGSFLLMKGEAQHHWYHSIPKTTKAVGPRINLTFRFIH
jgi:alkylated DNA repair dioxygenase AlkB